MSEKSIIEVLGENVTNMAFVNEAALLFVLMMAELEKTDALMMRIEASAGPEGHLPAEIVKNRVGWELQGQAKIAVCLKECLECVGDMTNGRDSASEPIITLFDEAKKGLDMIIDKQIEAAAMAAERKSE